ncbi:MAG: ergothioneine biosynthesis glutamate--cysteine ligase EgtA, partial [Actinomycetota bacterium]|nr:ergothioneine biosynthesis glutamate--cysteine ligase EgtA [Actinomycetota bacterium]
MTAQTSAALLSAPLSPEAAGAHAAAGALTASAVGAVGLELELHLVDLSRPARRASWPALQALLDDVPPLPFGSSITTEPGGQLELSTPAQPNVIDAIAALQADEHILRQSVGAAGFGLASVGADPVRPLDRVNPAPRYLAMEQHFDAVGCGAAGLAMMASTAALQINLNAGASAVWADRVAHIHRLGPALVAMSACSPLLAGQSSGWRSMRQQAWAGIDAARTQEVPASVDPARDWAAFALAAPVMMVRAGSGARACRERFSFAEWAAGTAPVERPPTVDDLDYHLSTLFPPVRMRGYLELRFLDAVPDRWWPALTAAVVTLIDDPVAADRAADACACLDGAWVAAARTGLGDPVIHTAVLGCLDIAARRCPPELRGQVEAYAELVARGRT